MSEKDITKFLQMLSLSKREIQVYMFLAKTGVQSTSFVAKRLKMERVQAYRTFKKLQEKGFIEATLERPTRFTIVPFESLVDTYINTKKNEISNLNEQKKELFTAWQALSAPETEYAVAKFAVITGKKKIYSKMEGMIEESGKEVLILTTSLGLMQEDIAGIFDAAETPSKKKNVKLQILTSITNENLKVAEQINKNIQEKKLNVKLRHLNLDTKFFPRFLIKDEQEAILYAPFGNEASMLNLEDEGLWINDKMFNSVLKAFFVQMWQIGTDASRRIEELKTGVQLGETLVIKGAEEAWSKITSVLESAKNEVVIITSSQGINRLAEKDQLTKLLNKNLSVRIMASIDLDNLEPAQKLSANYQVKHVPISYMTMMAVDNKHLFMFKTPPLTNLSHESVFYLPDTFYSSDPDQTERVTEMLNDIWKRGIEITEVSSQAGMKLPSVEVALSDTIEKAANAMLSNGVNSILLVENNKAVGVINDRQVLKEIVENGKDPKKTLVKDLQYTPLIILDSGESLIQAMNMMQRKKITRVAVVKNGQLIGMMTGDSTKKMVEQAAAKGS